MTHGPELFMDTDTIMFAKLLLAALLGGIVGTERALFARQNAGTRTFSLVSLGACLFIIAGNYVDSAYLGVVNFQPTYVLGAVVTGIGFLGAGLIIYRGDSLHGVTTAAGLWIAAALGVAVGLGMFSIAIFAELLTLIIFTGVWYIENKFKHWFQEHESISHGNRYDKSLRP